MLLLVSSAGIAQMSELVDNSVAFSTAGANVLIVGPIDISDCWVPATAIGSALVATDSAFVFKWVSTIFNTADSGSMAVDMGISNQYWKPSRGLAGSVTDSLAVTDSAGSYVKWFRAGDAILCAADADTIVIHAANTADQTETVLPGRIVTSSPKRYAYFRYTSGAANSAGNKSRHTVLVHRKE